MAFLPLPFAKLVAYDPTSYTTHNGACHVGHLLNHLMRLHSQTCP